MKILCCHDYIVIIVNFIFTAQFFISFQYQVLDEFYNSKENVEIYFQFEIF